MSPLATATDGTQLAWEAEGAGEPLLLIAGQATAMAGWGPAAAALAKHFRVIRFDHRGTGGSGRGDAGRYTTRLFAADALSVLQAAGAEAAHVYGHSMGGRVSQWLAIDHSARVRALILASTSAGRSGEGGDREAAAALISGDQNRMSPFFFDPAWAAQHPEAVRTFFNSGASAWAKSRHYAASTGHDTAGYLSLIQAPTLILHGTEDQLSPLANAQMLHRSIPHATLAKVPGGRHGVHLDHPETVDWIREFIQRRAANTGTARCGGNH
jgi:pimeloyl-ACP methyl ester carboxylesterase